MTEDNRHWKFYTDPDIIERKCNHCKEWMRFDRASAVEYFKDHEVYHWYCLLDRTTTYERNHTCYT